MRFLAPCIFGILFALAIGAVSSAGGAALLQRDVRILQGAR